MKYLIDANVFIDAKDFYYRTSVCPGFWDWLDSAVGGAHFGTIDRVRDELLKGNDDLANWFKDRRKVSWIVTSADAATQTAYKKVADWVNQGKVTVPAKGKFLSGADPWLLAKAMATKATVVTLEVPTNALNRISLANACDAFGVPLKKTWDLLEVRKVRFVLPPN